MSDNAFKESKFDGYETQDFIGKFQSSSFSHAIDSTEQEQVKKQ